MNDKQLKEFCNDAAACIWENSCDGGDIFMLHIIERFLSSKGKFTDYPPEYVSNLCIPEEGSDYISEEKFIRIVSGDLFDFIKGEAVRD